MPGAKALARESLCRLLRAALRQGEAQSRGMPLLTLAVSVQRGGFVPPAALSESFLCLLRERKAPGGTKVYFCACFSHAPALDIPLVPFYNNTVIIEKGVDGIKGLHRFQRESPRL